MRVYYDPISHRHNIVKPRAEKTESGYIVWLADFYDDYHGNSPTVEVSEQVYLCMMTAYWEEKRYLISVDRHQIPASFDETRMGDCQNVKSDAPDELLFQRVESEKLLNTIRQLDPELSNRIYCRYYLGMPLSKIAEKQGISVSAVSTSIQRGLLQLKRMMCNSDTQNSSP